MFEHDLYSSSGIEGLIEINLFSMPKNPPLRLILGMDLYSREYGSMLVFKCNKVLTLLQNKGDTQLHIYVVECRLYFATEQVHTTVCTNVSARFMVEYTQL